MRLARAALAVIATSLFCLALARADDWPQWIGPKRDAVWREKGILDRFPSGGPKKSPLSASASSWASVPRRWCRSSAPATRSRWSGVRSPRHLFCT